MATPDNLGDSWAVPGRGIMDVVPVLLAYLDRELVYRFCNATYRDWFGLKAEQVIGKPLEEVVGAKAFEIVGSYARRALSGERVTFEQLLPYRHGPARQVVAEYIPDRSDGRAIRGFFAMIRDVSDRIRADEAASRLAAVVAGSGDAILAKTLTGRVTAWNEAAERLYGYSAGEMIGQSIAKIFPRGRRRELKGLLASIKAGKAVKAFDTRRRRKDGSEFDVSLSVSPIRDAAGKVIGASSIARDIGERLALENELRRLTDTLETLVEERTAELEQSRSRWKAVFEMAGDGILIVDPRGRIESSNPAAEVMFGAGEELVGKRVRELFPKTHQERVRRNIGEISEGNGDPSGRFVLRAEEEAIHPDGSIFPVDLTASRAGEAGVVILIMRDITERRRMEREVFGASEEERKRVAAELHDSLGSQLGGIDCRLAVVQSVLESVAPAEERELNRVSKLLADAMRQARTIAHSLYAVGPEADSLARSLRILAASAQNREGVRARFHYPKPVAVQNMLVANHMYRIAQEAVNNAVKHSGGSRITIGLAGNEDRVVVAVKDNGSRTLPDRPEDAGIGMQIMRYRAHAIGASLVIQERRQGGLEVACSVERTRCDQGGEVPPAGDAARGRSA